MPRSSQMTVEHPRSASPDDRDVSILGVPIADWTMGEAVDFIEELMLKPCAPATTVFFANAHTLNTAFEEHSYRDVLRRGDRVFGDGSGVRWAARILHRVRLRDNVNGTDLVPALFASGSDRGFSYYLLGASEDSIERAAIEAQRIFPGWKQAGYHHGYLDSAASLDVIAHINETRPQLLLVGMGNPLQEIWLERNHDKLDVRVCLATGGLFDYWSGDIDRAPSWMRRIGVEWLHLLRRQPHKLRRYAIGNPRFIARVVRQRYLRSPS
jgi:N-acetylglucosaminyldiphosphoundecaprenol N-acetyl-beta-D-mannosaminyltransferase